MGVVCPCYRRIGCHFWSFRGLPCPIPACKDIDACGYRLVFHLAYSRRVLSRFLVHLSTSLRHVSFGSTRWSCILGTHRWLFSRFILRFDLERTEKARSCSLVRLSVLFSLGRWIDRCVRNSYEFTRVL